MSLYSGSVKRPVMTSLCFVAVLIIGLFSLAKLPIDLLPDIETNTIMVMTTYQGASAEDIEQNVTRPLENTLNSVEHLKHITSKSKENISIITLEFEYGGTSGNFWPSSLGSSSQIIQATHPRPLGEIAE